MNMPRPPNLMRNNEEATELLFLCKFMVMEENI